MAKLKNILILFIFVFAVSCGKSVQIPDELELAMEQVPEELDYNQHIKPILSDKCFSCHGPDAKKQKADLRLDVAEAAYEKETTSGLKAIDPGSLGNSEVIHRILSNDPTEVMPTPASHLTLSPIEKATLIKWIENGAEYKPHWAFIKPENPDLPKVNNEDWVKNDLDYFVLNKIEKAGLKPNPEADRETLIRRVALDVTGLPPTIKDIDAFVNDKAENAYEKMVDRYLGSTAYGERMATYWLDLARFADSHGYLDDRHRDQSPWRTWVINAYNKNLPFDKFVTWQMAGDLMPNATKEQILATAFNRNHKQNAEAGVIEEEFRVEYVVDRTNTLGTGLMALTVGCAKCHDHKYDPISQKDYFAMSAFFNSTFENGSPNCIGTDSIVAGPALLLTTPKQDKDIANLKKYISQLEKANKPALAANSIAQSLGAKSIAFTNFDTFWKKSTVNPKDKKVNISQGYVNLVNSEQPFKLANYDEKLGFENRKTFLMKDEVTVHLPPRQVGFFERYEPFAFSFWFKTAPKMFDNAVIFHSADSQRYGYQGYDVVLKNNRINFRLSNSYPHNAIGVLSNVKLDNKGLWHHVAINYDGSSKAAGIQIFINGKLSGIEVEYDNLTKTIKSIPNIHKYVPYTGVSFGNRRFDKSLWNSEIDDFYLFNNQITAQEVQYLQQKKPVDFTVQKTVNTPVQNTNVLYQTRKKLAEIYDSVQEIMVMGELPKPRKTYILERGVYDSYGEEVQHGTPEAILPYDEDLPKNRLGLSQWLFDEENPLTARVAVNRLWEMYFGRGIVKTSDDFGNQGSLPSHPEMLDYLAIAYQENGWDTKAILKMMMMSAFYRQTSNISKEHMAIDPQNILLARSPRYRMQAEMIRDNALAISGLLVNKIGGPSVYPYQPGGIWESLSDKVWRYAYLQDSTENLYRRSVYTFRKRSSPPPSMLVFDAPDRNFCTVKRNNSSSPLQALVLMNDPQFIEAARLIAERAMKESSNTLDAQLAYTHRLVTGRKPRANEMQLMKKMYNFSIDKLNTKPQLVDNMLNTGVKKADATLPKLPMVACSEIALALMNTDEFFVRK